VLPSLNAHLNEKLGTIYQMNEGVKMDIVKDFKAMNFLNHRFNYNENKVRSEIRVLGDKLIRKSENMNSHNEALSLALESTKRVQRHFDYDRYFRFNDQKLDHEMNIINANRRLLPENNLPNIDMQVFKCNARYDMLYPSHRLQKEKFGNYVKLIDQGINQKFDTLHQYL
jgi:hypothetical protein